MESLIDRAGARPRALVGPLSVATTVGMFLVLVMGATVTNTGSAEGCGRSWPLCHGQLIPELAVGTLIEFSHRAVTGVETILVLAFAAALVASYRRYRDAWLLAGLMVGALFLQAGMGAWAVLYPQQPLVIALHFGISLIAFGSALAATTFVRQIDPGPSPRLRTVPFAERRLAWASLGFVLIVVYLGAYVRHSGMEMGCIDWPLCNGQVFPGFAGPAGVVFIHRLAALGAIALLALLAWQTWQQRTWRPDLLRGSLTALVLVIAQALTGALVVATRLGLWSALLHAGVMALLFGTLADVCLGMLPLAIGGGRLDHEGHEGARTGREKQGAPGPVR